MPHWTALQTTSTAAYYYLHFFDKRRQHQLLPFFSGETFTSCNSAYNKLGIMVTISSKLANLSLSDNIIKIEILPYFL